MINIFIVIFGLAAVSFLPMAQYPNIVPPTIQITSQLSRRLGRDRRTHGRDAARTGHQRRRGHGLHQQPIDRQRAVGHHGDLQDRHRPEHRPELLTQNRVQDTLSRLPQEVQLQGVQVKKTIQALLLGVHVYSPDGSRSPEYMSNYMLKIRDQIARLPGVADFRLFGDREYAMRIWIDPDKAAAVDVSASEILARCVRRTRRSQQVCSTQPPVTSKAAYQINVEALGRLTTPEQFGNIIVKSDNQGRVTRIRDIGRVELGSVDYGSIAYADRYPSAPWFPIATPGANVVQVEHAIWDKMAELKKTFPPGLDYINDLRSDDLREPVDPRGHRDDRSSRSSWWSAWCSCSCRPGGPRSFRWSRFRSRWSARSQSSPRSASRSTTCRCSV